MGRSDGEGNENTRRNQTKIQEGTQAGTVRNLKDGWVGVFGAAFFWQCGQPGIEASCHVD